MLTVIVSHIEKKEELKQTMDSLMGQQQDFWQKIRVILVQDLKALNKDSETIKSLTAYEKTLCREYAGQIALWEMDGESVWKACEEAVKSVTTPYVTMIHSGDAYLPDALPRGCAYLEKLNGEADVLSYVLSFSERKKIPKMQENPAAGQGEILYRLDEAEGYTKYPSTFEGCVFRTESVQGMAFREEHGFEIWDEFVCRVLDKKRTFAFLNDTYFLTVQPKVESVTYNPDIMHKRWYLDSVEKHCLPMAEEYAKKYGTVPGYVQCHILFLLRIRFKNNMDQKNYRIFSETELEAYLAACGKVLRYLDDELLVKRQGAKTRLRLTESMSEAFLKLKYGDDLRRTYQIEHVPDRDRDELTVNILGASMILYPKLCIDLMDSLDAPEHGMELEVRVPGYVSEEGFPMTVLLNGQRVEAVKTCRYASHQFFGKTIYKESTYRIVLPVSQLKGKNVLQFVLEQGEKRISLPIVTKRYPSRVSDKVEDSWWDFENYLVRLKREGEPEGLYISRAGAGKKAAQELRMLYHMCFGKRPFRKMAAFRMLYWLTYPYYHKKNIWVTFDKLYKGGDCGEYFYKYMCSRKDTDVVPVYVINGDSSDRKRLENEGFHPSVRGTRKQKLMFTHAKLILGTHVGIVGFNGFDGKQIVYIQDRLRFTNMCIQHGLTVQDLAYDANRVFNNNKKYYCASRYEVQNLLQSQYDYRKEQVCLTGIPRYDGLINNDQRQILITPTWRNYIAMPAVMGSTRPYNPDFKNTEYFRIYNALISDSRLTETAKRTGYKLIYLLHPITSAQLEDYDKRENVEILQATTINYEKILTESSLMVTDYSGVQFDFAYMRKPVVYYHPPALPPHYEEGGFFYDTQGFGEICTEHDQLVDILCGYMEHECRLKPFYKERQDDFFAFSDHYSCQRIFEDAYQWQKERKAAQ